VGLRAAIVGLGRVGMLFDDDPSRDRTWTHFSAYERLSDRFELVAVCDTDPARLARASDRLPAVRTFAALEEMLDSEPLDVISICTPISLHTQQVETCAPHARAIVCEKPLSIDLPAAESAVRACAASGTLLAVNYYKRFESSIRRAAHLIAEGSVGAVHSGTALYAGPFDAVGSHAVDLLDFLLGPLGVSAAVGGSALLTFGDAGVAALMSTGPREDLVFEIDVVGAEGRIRIVDNCERLEVSRFTTSTRYGGYRELAPPTNEALAPSEPFLSLFSELADVLDGEREQLTSDGASALRTQAILDAIQLDAAPI
jgi:predicted dehydrogenase